MVTANIRSSSTTAPFIPEVVDVLKARLAKNDQERTKNAEEHAVLTSMLSLATGGEVITTAAMEPSAGGGSFFSSSLPTPPAQINIPTLAKAPVRSAHLMLPTKELRDAWKNIKGADVRKARRTHMLELFKADAHQHLSNERIAKGYNVSKSLVSLFLNEAIQANICRPRAGAGGRAKK